MSLVVTGVHGEPKTDDFGNLSYWVSIEGFEGNVLVTHKPSAPVLKVGDDALANGWDRVDTKTSKAGKSYQKLARPIFQGGGNAAPRQEDPKRSAAIGRMHDQDMALRAVELATTLGLAKPASTADLFDLVAKTADWFAKDTAKAKDAA